MLCVHYSRKEKDMAHLPQQPYFEKFINECQPPLNQAIKDWWANYYDEGFNFSDIHSWEANFPNERREDIPLVSITLHIKDKTFHRDFYLIELRVYE
jgi:hypothetical protein